MVEDTGTLGKPDLKLGGLRIWVHNLSNRRALVDGWLDVTVECKTLNSRVVTNGSIILFDEMQRWIDEAEKIHQKLSGTAVLRCLEPELGVEMTLDKAGKMKVVVDITPDFNSEEHRFNFNYDQTYLPEFISAGRSVLTRCLKADAR